MGIGGTHPGGKMAWDAKKTIPPSTKITNECTRNPTPHTFMGYTGITLALQS